MIEYKALKKEYHIRKFRKRFEESMENKSLNKHYDWYRMGGVSEAERNGTVEPTDERKYRENARKQLSAFVEKTKRLFGE